VDNENEISNETINEHELELENNVKVK